MRRSEYRLHYFRRILAFLGSGVFWVALAAPALRAQQGVTQRDADQQEVAANDTAPPSEPARSSADTGRCRNYSAR